MRRLNSDQRQRCCQLPWRTVPHEPNPTGRATRASGSELDRQRLPPSHEFSGADLLSSQFQCRSCEPVFGMPCHRPRKCYHIGRSASGLGQLEFHQHCKSSGDGWYVEHQLLELFQVTHRILVSIDDHPMWVYAVDGRYIVPQLVDVCISYRGPLFSS
jgi:hypothetical protein